MSRRACTACGGPASPRWALCSACRRAAVALATRCPMGFDADGLPCARPKDGRAGTDLAQAWLPGVNPQWPDSRQPVLSYGFDITARTTGRPDDGDSRAREAWRAVRDYLRHAERCGARRCRLCGILIPTHGEYAVIRPVDDGCGWCGELRRDGITLCRPCVETLAAAGMSPFAYWGDLPCDLDQWAMGVLHRACLHHDGDPDEADTAAAYAWRSGLYRLDALATGDPAHDAFSPYEAEPDCGLCEAPL